VGDLAGFLGASDVSMPRSVPRLWRAALKSAF
jgi:hypothetical protein